MEYFVLALCFLLHNAIIKLLMYNIFEIIYDKI